EILFAAEANDLVHNFAAFEDQERWNGMDLVLQCEVLIVIHIHFPNANFSIVLGRELVENRSDRAARTAPLSPKVDQHRNRRLEDILVKIRFCNGKDICSHSCLNSLGSPSCYCMLNTPSHIKAIAASPTTAAAIANAVSSALMDLAGAAAMGRGAAGAGRGAGAPATGARGALEGGGATVAGTALGREGGGAGAAGAGAWPALAGAAATAG